MSFPGQIIQGSLSVITTEGRGLSTDQLADMFLARLMQISDEAVVPDHVKQQLVAYRGAIESLARTYLLQAKNSARTSIVAELERAGYLEAAHLARTL